LEVGFKDFPTFPFDDTKISQFFEFTKHLSKKNLVRTGFEPVPRQVIGTDLSVTPISARYHYGT